MTNLTITEEEILHLARCRAPRIAREPRGRFTLRIGAIGHRLLNEHQTAAVTEAARAVFGVLRQDLEQRFAGSNNVKYFAGKPTLVVVSSLAEGADRLLSTVGLARGCALGAILPFSVSKYETTFTAEPRCASLEQFRNLLNEADRPPGLGVAVLDGDSRADRIDESYLHCASAILDVSDILIAVLSEDRWESHTGIVTRAAIDARLPAILIQPTADGSAIVRINDLICQFDSLESEIRNILDRIVSPSLSESPIAFDAFRLGSDTYVSEQLVCNWDVIAVTDVEPFRARTVAPFWIGWCSGLNRMMDVGVGRLLRLPAVHRRKEGLRELVNLDLSLAAASWLVDLYLRYARADALANAYGELHRSGQIVIVALGVATIAFGSIFPSVGFGRPIFAAAELFCLLLVLAFATTAHRQAWLERWLNYRLLAEICRCTRFLVLAGRDSPFEPDAAAIPRDRNWVREHVQALLRERPLACVVAGRNMGQPEMAGTKEYFAGYFFAPQIQYHKLTCEMRRRLATGLRTATFAMSLLTVVVVALKLVFSFKWATASQTEPTLQHMLNIAAIAFPAITGAVLALRAFGEHDVVATRSGNVALLLEVQQSMMQRAVDLHELGEAILRATRMLLVEVDGWRDIFADKQLE